MIEEPFTVEDSNWMSLAIRLARRGEGAVEPNPMVGCVIVQSAEIGHGKLLGVGWHRKFGEPHAEVEALRDCRRGTEGATVYVTLEPCSHHGKTGPCTEALISAKVGRVVIACEDPHESVNGQGIEELRKAGIVVDIGLGRDSSEQLLAPYMRRIRDKRPWVIGKWAMTADGKIATRTGDSQWISCEKSREIVHQLRNRVDAILVGNNTVSVDDPLLTARVEQNACRTPIRVVIDRELKTELSSQIVQTADTNPTLLFGGRLAPIEKKAALEEAGCEVILTSDPSPWNHLKEILDRLGERDVTNLLVEGGGQTLGTFFDQRLIDEFHVFVAPKACGGADAPSAMLGKGLPTMSHSLEFARTEVDFVGRDIYLKGFAK